MSRYTLRTVDSNGRVIGATRHVTIASAPGDEAPPPPAVYDDDPYPDAGNVADVLDWVDDPTIPDAVRSDRAKAAIAAEHGRAQPRKTLLRQLQERTG